MKRRKKNFFQLAGARTSEQLLSLPFSGFELQWRSVVAELCLARRAADRLMEIGRGAGGWVGGRRRQLISE